MSHSLRFDLLSTKKFKKLVKYSAQTSSKAVDKGAKQETKSVQAHKHVGSNSMDTLLRKPVEKFWRKKLAFEQIRIYEVEKRPTIFEETQFEPKKKYFFFRTLKSFKSPMKPPCSN